jgi:hypothetical protein
LSPSPVAVVITVAVVISVAIVFAVTTAVRGRGGGFPFLGVLSAGAPSEEAVTAFVIDEAPLPACATMRWGGRSCSSPNRRHVAS